MWGFLKEYLVYNRILNKTLDILKNNGNFITFKYSLVKKQFFKDYFRNIYINRAFINLAPAYILRCKSS